MRAIKGTAKLSVDVIQWDGSDEGVEAIRSEFPMEYETRSGEVIYLSNNMEISPGDFLVSLYGKPLGIYSSIEMEDINVRYEEIEEDLPF